MLFAVSAANLTNNNSSVLHLWLLMFADCLGWGGQLLSASCSLASFYCYLLSIPSVFFLFSLLEG